MSAVFDDTRHHHDDVSPDRELVRLLGHLDDILDHLASAETQWHALLAPVAADYRSSARNIVHYWALRQIDMRAVQRRLAAFGLSSLGHSESHVQATIRLVRSAASAMLGKPWQPPAPAVTSGTGGRRLLRSRSVDLLGPAPATRETRIMVTLPSSAATDPDLTRRLIAGGMNIARINCAHDDAAAWSAMAGHVRQAARDLGRDCRIAMDLAGPKLRTGPLEPGPRCVKLRPRRDAVGHVVTPARARLSADAEPVGAATPQDPTIPVPAAWLSRRKAGDVITLHDARGAKRHLTLIADPDTGGLIATTDKTTYLLTGTELTVQSDDDPAPVGLLPEIEQSLTLHRGDVLHLTRDCSPAPVHAAGPPRIGCTLPDVFDNARVGEAIHFDDGRISGEIRTADPDTLTVRITRAAAAGSKLKAAKGINVPETTLPVPALTDKDIADLETAVQIADLVEMSFVQDPTDILRLHELLDRPDGERIGIVLKIETRRAFERLPQLLLTAMRRPRLGVMIARGDLGVEVGYERLAELQEEILWLCEAAHLPVVWATQVLEQLATTGLPSRAEISDAAMGERAECVMLNKGPHIDDALAALDDILHRMSGHHDKKDALLRRLRSWHPDHQ